MFIDRNSLKGKKSDRSMITVLVCAAITVVACLVAADGLGSNGIAPADMFKLEVAGWNDCWLDFMDCWSEGLAMPIGAMIMALIIGWEKGSDSLYGEIEKGYSGNVHTFYRICIKYIVPVVMCFISAGSIADFFGSQSIGYLRREGRGISPPVPAQPLPAPPGRQVFYGGIKLSTKIVGLFVAQ